MAGWGGRSNFRREGRDWNMKLFEEIARSLRLVKGVHQPEVLEPETPASAPEFEIIVPSDAAARHAGFSPELRDTIRVIRHGARDVKAGAGFCLSSAEDCHRTMILPRARQ